MSQQLIPSLDIDAFISSCSDVVAMITEAHGLLIAARQKCASLGIDEYDFNRAMSSGSHETLVMVKNPKWLEASCAALHAKAWDQLFHLSGLRSFMDRKARSDWDAQIANCATPPLTMDVVRPTFKRLYDERERMLKRGLVNLFDSLHPRYDANSVWAFKERFILSYVFGYPPCPTLTHTAFDALDDLIRVFCLLDQQPQPDHRNNVYQQARNVVEANTYFLSTPYFDMKLFRGTRTGHVRITRKDLLDKVNLLLAQEYGNTLPEDRSSIQKGRRQEAGTAFWG